MIDYDLLKEINANSNDELELIILEIANLKKRERDFEDSILTINNKLEVLIKLVFKSSYYIEEYKNLLSTKSILYRLLLKVKKDIIQKKKEMYYLVLGEQVFGEMFHKVNSDFTKTYKVNKQNKIVE